MNKIVAVLSMVLSVLLASDAVAKKGGGGKPPATPTPPGQVFYDYSSYDGASVGYAVDGDGNNPVIGVQGTPSYEFHADAAGVTHRWFLQWVDSPTEGKDIIAVRDDDVGLENTIQLTNDPNLYIPFSTVQPVWVPGTGDSAISFIGMDLNTDESSIFKLDVGFDSHSGAPSPAPAAVPAWTVPTVYWEPGFGAPDAHRHSWSDDGRYLVYAGNSPDHAGIHVVDIEAGTETTVAQGSRPSISPDGSAVAFVSPAFDLSIVNTDGTGETILVESKHRGDKTTRHFAPFWSPDLDPDPKNIQYDIIWQQRYEHIRWAVTETDVWRVDRDGSNPVNLTFWVDFDPSGGPNPWLLPTGWRADGGSASASFSEAIPEPASIVLLVIGSWGLIRLRWRRSRSH